LVEYGLPVTGLPWKYVVEQAGGVVRLAEEDSILIRWQGIETSEGESLLHSKM